MGGSGVELGERGSGVPRGRSTARGHLAAKCIFSAPKTAQSTSVGARNGVAGSGASAEPAPY